MAMQDMRQSNPMASGTPSGMGMNVPPPAGAPMPEHHGRTGVLWSIIIIILIILGALWFLGKGTTDNVWYDDDGNMITQAPAGQLIDGFPAELLLEQDATIDVSYVIDYSGRGQKMPVARYTSSMQYNETTDGYRRLLIAGGWVVLKDGSIDEVPVTNFSATRGEEEVNITLTLQPDGKPVVEIAYSMPAGQ